jgi:DMSO/TMAO reductase YedYZ molybdopterin-dependent catalytic subunit
MMLSPYFAPRTWTGIIVLGVTAAGVVYSDIDFDRRFIRRLVTVTLCFGIVIFAVKFAYVYAVDVRPFGEQWVDRVNLIQEAKASGRHDLAVPAVVAKTTYNASYDIKDLDPNPAEWPNADVARFYGVSSIRVD